MPHVPVNDEPGFSLIRASPVRNAFGGQVICSTAFTDMYRQAGVYTGRILKGESPGELPIMQSMKAELVKPRPRGVKSDARGRLVGDETVDQTGATTSFQLILTATARAMRGVPGIHVSGILESGTVMVTHDR